MDVPLEILDREVALAVAALARGHARLARGERTPSPLEASIERSERRQLDLALESLPERERMIVRMHYYKGEQFKVIAEELGVSEPRVSQLHARAVTLLRRAMTDSAERSRTQAA
jgi:RNA polymerase sigma factor for flagellar operon FliA